MYSRPAPLKQNGCRQANKQINWLCNSKNYPMGLLKKYHCGRLVLSNRDRFPYYGIFLLIVFYFSLILPLLLTNPANANANANCKCQSSFCGWHKLQSTDNNINAIKKIQNPWLRPQTCVFWCEVTVQRYSTAIRSTVHQDRDLMYFSLWRITIFIVSLLFRFWAPFLWKLSVKYPRRKRKR